MLTSIQSFQEVSGTFTCISPYFCKFPEFIHLVMLLLKAVPQTTKPLLSLSNVVLQQKFPVEKDPLEKAGLDWRFQRSIHWNTLRVIQCNLPQVTYSIVPDLSVHHEEIRSVDNQFLYIMLQLNISIVQIKTQNLHKNSWTDLIFWVSVYYKLYTVHIGWDVHQSTSSSYSND